jgi:hypothetical protein
LSALGITLLGLGKRKATAYPQRSRPTPSKPPGHPGAATLSCPTRTSSRQGRTMLLRSSSCATCSPAVGIDASRRAARCTAAGQACTDTRRTTRGAGASACCGRPLLAALCAPEGELVWRCCRHARVGGSVREGGVELCRCWSTRMEEVSSGSVPCVEKLLAKQQGGTVD